VNSPRPWLRGGSIGAMAAGGAGGGGDRRARSAHCLVLDLDGTLIDSCDVSVAHELPFAGTPAAEPAHVTADGDAIFVRPHARDFLRFCERHCAAVGVWTKSGRAWADAVVNGALKEHASSFSFVFAGDRCTTVATGGGGGWRDGGGLPPELGGLPVGLDLGGTGQTSIKRLRKVWNASSRRAAGFRKETTMIVEDSPENCVANYGNALYISTYDVFSQPAAGPDDDQLLRLAHYLASIAAEADVRRVEKRGWHRRVSLLPHAPLPPPGVPAAADATAGDDAGGAGGGSGGGSGGGNVRMRDDGDSRRGRKTAK